MRTIVAGDRFREVHMYFLALAADFDGTLAMDGVVATETLKALGRLKRSGRKLILVTGREMRDLRPCFPEVSLFDRVVAENGGVIYDPATDRERLLAPAPSVALVRRLEDAGVGPVSIGRTVIATWEPHQAAVVEAIRETGLELQIAFNKGAIMVLPSGVNKSSGLRAALGELDISPHNVCAVGDAENDHSFLSLCGCSAVVANAVKSLIEEADIRLRASHGAGVVELVERMLGDERRLACPEKHGLLVGTDDRGGLRHLMPFGGSVLILGGSGSGKSMLTTALTERMVQKGMEFCGIDPEGDYVDLEDTVYIGNARTPPVAAEALGLLRDDSLSLVLNIQALALESRRDLFALILEQIVALRSRTGRPHWTFIDEAHQMFTDDPGEKRRLETSGLRATILVTAYPEALPHSVLATVDVVLALGVQARAMTEAVAIREGWHLKDLSSDIGSDGVLFWKPKSTERPCRLELPRPVQYHRRHMGKYAVGDVGAERSFYFRGRDKSQNVPARNLYRFLDIASEVDDEVWSFHLRAGDYANWFRHVIKDEDLAAETEAIAGDANLLARETRQKVRKAVWRRYAAPCEADRREQGRSHEVRGSLSR